jgi:hypothetical protein
MRLVHYLKLAKPRYSRWPKVSGMKGQTLAIMRRLLRPVSAEQMAEIARQRTMPGSCEQLTLADAGLEDEVRELIRRRKSRRGEPLP